MKKINENGFILAESIITAVFILGIFTFLIVNVFPLVSKYDKVLDYDNPEDIYSANLLMDALEEEKISEETFYDYIKKKLENGSFIYFKDINNDQKKKIIPNDNITICETNYCKSLISKDFLNITDILFIKGNVSSFNGLKRGMKEYAKYFIKQNKKVLNDNNNEKIAILVRFNNGKYASIWLGDNNEE